VRQREALSTGYKSINQTYFWKVIPYGIDGIQAINCPVWSFSTQSAVIKTFPYYDDFENETANLDWIALGQASSWTLGTPTKNGIFGAASGTHAWVTSLAGTYNASESSSVRSPVFDFSGMSRDPVIGMSIYYDSEEGFDGTVLQSSVNGSIWQTVGSAQDPNWYNNNNIASSPGGSSAGWTGSSSGWIKVSHVLTGLAGQPQVVIRVAFASDAVYQFGGFAFDNVSIVVPPPPPTTASPTTASPPIATTGGSSDNLVSSTKGGTPTGIIIGVSVAGVIIFAIALGAVVFYMRKKTAQKTSNFYEMDDSLFKK